MSAAFTVSVAPICRATSSFVSSMSTAIILPAPAIRAAWMAARPIPPAPKTATVSPASTRAVLNTAPTPVMTPQPISEARSRGISSRIFTIACSWTSICSANDERLRNCQAGAPSIVRRGASFGPRLHSRSLPEHREGLPSVQ